MTTQTNRALPSDTLVKQNPSAWMSFWSGLISPTTFSIGMTIVVAAAISISVARAITESWVARHGDLLCDGQDDVWSRVTRDALVLKTAPAPRAALVLLGDLRGERIKPSAEERANDAAPRIHDLRTPDQTLYEAFALVDQIPATGERAGARHQVVLVVSPNTLRVRAEFLEELYVRPPIGVRSVAATVELIDRGVSAIPLRENYFIDNQAFLISRAPAMARNLARNVLKRPMGETGFVARQWPRLRRTNDGEVQRNLASLNRFLVHLEHRGMITRGIVFWTPSGEPESELARLLMVSARAHFVKFITASADTNGPDGLPPEWMARLGENS